MTEEQKNTKADDKKEAVEAKKTVSAKPGDLKPGMTVRVHEKIKETNAKGEEKQRIQIFEGMIIAIKKPLTVSGTITVRKISENGIGVEKIYPLKSPLVEKIVPVKQARVRRAKLYYLRNHKKRLTETKI